MPFPSPQLAPSAPFPAPQRTSLLYLSSLGPVTVLRGRTVASSWCAQGGLVLVWTKGLICPAILPTGTPGSLPRRLRLADTSDVGSFADPVFMGSGDLGGAASTGALLAEDGDASRVGSRGTWSHPPLAAGRRRDTRTTLAPAGDIMAVIATAPVVGGLNA